MTEPLLCPECVESGDRSRVASLGGARNLMGYTPFYDEDGQYHQHDPNVLTSGYKCSNGHVFTRKSHSPCPTCGPDWMKPS